MGIVQAKLPSMTSFVVDAGLTIHGVKVLEADWKSSYSGIFCCVGRNEAIVLKGHWDGRFMYAGFETLEEAEHFCAMVYGAEEQSDQSIVH